MEKIERWLWSKKLDIYFFFKHLIREIQLEQEARKYYPANKVARTQFKAWRRHLKRVDELTPKERELWYEEEESKWKGYYNNLL